jgi:hypothetical protein
MKRISCGLLVLALSSPGTLEAQERLVVTIKSPSNGAGVDLRHEVSGRVSDPNADVWVVIHPIERSDFWVQPQVSVQDDGSWKVLAFFGTASSIGKRFEVRAFANPIGNIARGKTSNWPKAAARSKLIETVRR